MVRIVVFDSGLGSLSVIKAIQKISKSEIIYFADQENYPYGKKTKNQLSKIIQKSIITLKKEFSPDIIVMASNTPSLMLDLANSEIVDVKPPIMAAQKISKSKQIGILATRSTINSIELDRYIVQNNLRKSFKIFKINGSELVDLVESGKFITNKEYCKKIIKQVLDEVLSQSSIDVITLSSTHLPFLRLLLKKQYSKINFIDSTNIIAEKVFLKIKKNQSKKNSLKIFASGDTKLFQTKLNRIGISNKVKFLSI